MENELQHVFLVGAKSLGAYGGFETFVFQLTKHHQFHPHLQYHLACKAQGPGSLELASLEGALPLSDGSFLVHNARCVPLDVPNLGPAQAILYDLAALASFCRYIKQHDIPHPVVYIMACRIGPFAPFFFHKINRLGGRLLLNPDGHEWRRAKWPLWVRLYWKFSERCMIRNCHRVICDSKAMERYIHRSYDRKFFPALSPKTSFIAYGAFTRPPSKDFPSPPLLAWLDQHNLQPHQFFLIVARFVPENNLETILREFLLTSTSKPLVIISDVQQHFWNRLQKKIPFQKDPRIRFVGSLYDAPLLQDIRQVAFAYLHGHEVGGTNPSLLEALGATDVNLLLDVSFNREVAKDAALYWSKQPGSLAALIEAAEGLSPKARAALGKKARHRIHRAYRWSCICKRYEHLWQEEGSLAAKDPPGRHP